MPGEFHGQSLAGYSSWGCKESDTTEQLTHTDTHTHTHTRIFEMKEAINQRINELQLFQLVCFNRLMPEASMEKSKREPVWRFQGSIWVGLRPALVPEQES